jgi:signal transduction histidine kinase
LKHLDGDRLEAREIDAAVGETDTLIATFNALLLIADAEAGVAREAMAAVDLPAVVEGICRALRAGRRREGLSLDRCA